MKKLYKYFTLLLAFVTLSCHVNEAPVFKELKKINIEKANLKEVVFETDAIFENINSIGGNITCKELTILVDGVEVGKIEPMVFDVPAKSDFVMPIKGTFYTKNILKREGKLLNNLFNAVKSKKINLGIKGDLLFKKGPLDHEYHLEETQEVNLKF